MLIRGILYALPFAIGLWAVICLVVWALTR